MEPFLKRVATDLRSQFPKGFENVTLVFPNRRAGLFFNHYLTQTINQPIWAPKFTSIGEMMLNASGLKLADPIALVSKLYRTYQKVSGSSESFDDFYFWGEVLLSDFDQIDKYLVDAKALFANVDDLKEIDNQFDFLTPEQREALNSYLGTIKTESALVDKHLEIWKKLWPIYDQFKNELIKSGECYEGMAYREACKKLDNLCGNADNPSKFVFIGFNALNGCENKLFSFCKENNMALFYWDRIGFLEPSDEANQIISNNLKLYPCALSSQNGKKRSDQPKITLVESPNTVSQAKVLPRLFGEMANNGTALGINTAVVLSNERILLPVLQSIPDSFSDINISIGYPLKDTPAYTLAEQLVKLQMNARSDKDGGLFFYHKNVLALLAHPFVVLCAPNETSTLQAEVRQRNLVYPPSTLFAGSPFLAEIFKKTNGTIDLCNYLQAICTLVAQEMSTNNEDAEERAHQVNSEFLYALYKSVGRLKTNLEIFGFDVELKTFLQLLRKAFSQERVSFEGEPLSGIQVMGLLETRTLDFENLIVLSFNDDLIPGKPNHISFVVPSLRVAYGLPSHREGEAIYAYNFFRLLSRSKKVFLVYSGRNVDGSSGELSRFAQQLLLEYMPNSIQRVNMSYALGFIPNKPITVEKHSEVMDQMKANLSKGNGKITLSPSGLINYIVCPLRFYFRYVVGLYESDEVSEEVDAPLIGLIIHSTIELLYGNFVGQLVQKSDVEHLRNDQKAIKEAINSSMSHNIGGNGHSPMDEQLSGRNLLIRGALLKMVETILQIDEQRAPFHLVGHEYEANFSISPKIQEAPTEVTIKGSIDRLEGSNGNFTVIDFKTGSATDKGSFKELSELFDTKRILKTKEVFQIFCYSHAVMKRFPHEAVKPLVWFVRSIKPGNDSEADMCIKNNGKAIENYLDYANDFENELVGLVEQIFDVSQPFAQTDYADNCKFCPYKLICNK